MHGPCNRHTLALDHDDWLAQTPAMVEPSKCVVAPEHPLWTVECMKECASDMQVPIACSLLKGSITDRRRSR